MIYPQFISFNIQHQIEKMGNSCCNDNNSAKTNFDAPTMSSPIQIQNKLVLSQNFHNIVKKEQQELFISRMKATQSICKSNLILPATVKYESQPLVRYHLMYSFYIDHYEKQKKSQKVFQAGFFKFCQESSKGQNTNQLEKEFLTKKNDLDKWNFMLNSCFIHKFLLETINYVPLTSNDPKDIGYLLFPLHAIKHGISDKYKKKRQEYFKTFKSKEIFLVVCLSKDEENLLKGLMNTQSCFAFSVFMRGFTSEKYAQQKRKELTKTENVKAHIFRIILKYPLSKMSSQYDLGFFIHENPTQDIKKQGDVIFNLLNYFEVSNTSTPQQRDWSIHYGILPYRHHVKKERLKGYENIDDELLRIYGLANAVSKHYINSQSCLLRTVSNHQDSIRASRSANAGKTQRKEMSDLEKENIINNYIDQKNYKEALKQTDGENSTIIRAKRLECYFLLNQEEQFEKLLDQLRGQTMKLYQINENLEKASDVRDEIAKKQKPKLKRQQQTSYQIVESMNAKQEINQNKVKKAIKNLTRLQGVMLYYYNENDFQFFGKDVEETLKQCYTMVDTKKKENEEDKKKAVDWAKYTKGLKIRISAVGI